MTIRKTTLKVGLDIPVKVDTMVDDSRIGFKNVCPTCHNKLSYKKICEKCGKEVDYHDMKKGYELDDDMIVFDREAVKKLREAVNPDGMETVKVVSRENLDLNRTINKSYYLKPQDGARNRYSVMYEALIRKDYAVIVKYAIKSRQKLYAVYGNKDGLIMTEIAYPTQIRSADIKMEEVGKEEIEKGVRILEGLKKETESETVKNEYREKLNEAIEKKMEGEELEAEKEVEKKEKENLEKELDEALAKVPA